MVCVAVPLAGIAPIEQVIGFAPLHVPCVDVAELSVTFGGSVIMAVTLAAADGPLFATTVV
jgi:hypothetical protein